jgi:prevent-host-death family protein
MCYMDSGNRVGVRELRQNLSVYLRRVAAGESFEVTERGRRVAVLGPPPEESTPLGRLVSSGRAGRPDGDLLELGPPRTQQDPPSSHLGDALEAEREERG